MDGPGSSTRATHNLLVVSDLHFGETLAPSEPGYVKQVARLNQAFCRFLEYYEANRVGGRPWRLVIAGDMIDFVRASVVATQLSLQAVSDARADGGGGAGTAVSALELIVAHHRRVFRDLAAFVAAGNELVIIKGNHDVEFHWEEVQARFAEILAGLQRRSVRDWSETGDDGFATRIIFCRWFWYEDGLVYIEHGNQYDEFCSFEHVLSPEIPDERRLEDPISHQTFRAFANLVPTLDVHGIDRWGIPDFARWLASLGPRVIGRLAYTYFASLSWMVRTKQRLGRAGRSARAAHRHRFAELALRFRLREEVIEALDNLRHRPAGSRIFSGIQMLYMDRIFLAAATLLVLFGATVMPAEGLVRASVAGGAFGASVAGFLLLARLREVEAHPKLLRVARKVRELVKVPFVVFGHSHVPVRQAIGTGWYFNTGSWSGDAKGGLTHLCITVGGQAEAELRTWDDAARVPVPIELG